MNHRPRPEKLLADDALQWDTNPRKQLPDKALRKLSRQLQDRKEQLEQNSHSATLSILRNKTIILRCYISVNI